MKYLHPSELTKDQLLAIDDKFGIYYGGSIVRDVEIIRDWYSYWFRCHNVCWLENVHDALARARLKGNFHVFTK